MLDGNNEELLWLTSCEGIESEGVVFSKNEFGCEVVAISVDTSATRIIIIMKC